MLNKYIPRYKCENCNSINWNHDLNTHKFRCRKCNKFINKIVRTLSGSKIYKHNNFYILEYTKFKERSIFNNINDLFEELNKI